jgi:GNAT superfamily N-acetyltransferase
MLRRGGGWPCLDDMRIRDGRPEEAATLSELSVRSKAHWGYDAAFMAACRAELTLRPEDVPAQRTRVAEDAGRIVGFVTVVGDPPNGEVGALFIEPHHIGGGVGRALWNDAIVTAGRAGFTMLTIDADPDAEGFYLRMGAVRTGDVASGSIPGRLLPRLTYEIRESVRAPR